MKGTVQAIIRADDGSARPFATINVDDVDAALTELQGMASAAPATPPAPADLPLPTPPSPDIPAGAVLPDPTATPTPIADQTAPATPPAPPPANVGGSAPTDALAGSPPPEIVPQGLYDRVASLESRVSALEKTPAAVAAA